MSYDNALPCPLCNTRSLPPPDGSAEAATCQNPECRAVVDVHGGIVARWKPGYRELGPAFTLYERRAYRLQRFIQIEAPHAITAHAARMLIEAHCGGSLSALRWMLSAWASERWGWCRARLWHAWQRARGLDAEQQLRKAFGGDAE